VNYIMLRDNLTFKAAARVLNAWSQPESLVERNSREQHIAQGRAAYTREETNRARQRIERLNVREELLSLIAMERTVGERLTALHWGAIPRGPNEIEDYLKAASLLVEEIREADAEYVRAAGLEGER
jgi:hypothetical protein